MRFFLQISTLFLLSAGCIWGWNRYVAPEKQLNALWLILAVCTTATTLIHLILTRSASQQPTRFVRYFLAATSLKLFTYLIIIILYSLFNRQNAVVFIVGFLLLYLAFTIFEVVVMLRFLRKSKQSLSDQ